MPTVSRFPLQGCGGRGGSAGPASVAEMTRASVLLPSGETIVPALDAPASERASVVKYGFSEIFKDVYVCAFKRAASLKCV